ncbi:MAG: pseudouridine synthase [Pseudomonadota bacterium]
MNAVIPEQEIHPSLIILYQDVYLVAVNKPAGLLVHRSPVDRREKSAAVPMLRNQIRRHVYPVHRLDRPTSGVLLFALSPEAARKMSSVFQSRNVKKRYIALVRGYTPESGMIDYPVKEVKDRYLPFQNQDVLKRYPAVTLYNRLATIELPVEVDRYPSTRYSLVELYPLTGRRHQLRNHMKHISHPIVGDTRYGQTPHNHFFRKEFQCRQLLLCAKELTFLHPETGKEIRIIAPYSADFQKILIAFRWDRLVSPETGVVTR